MTKYRVIFQNTTVEFLDKPVADKYCSDNSGIRVDEINETDPLPQMLQLKVDTWRIRAICNIMGLSANIEALLNTLPEPAQTVAKVAWQQGSEVETQSNTVKFLQAGLNLTNEQVINIFTQAAALDA